MYPRSMRSPNAQTSRFFGSTRVLGMVELSGCMRYWMLGISSTPRATCPGIRHVIVDLVYGVRASSTGLEPGVT